MNTIWKEAGIGTRVTGAKPYILVSVCFLLSSLSIFAQPRLVTIDSTQLWINTIGLDSREEGQPVVVFESGHGTPMDNWDQVIAKASELAPVLTYDRPGIGKSEAVDELPSLKNVADRLVKLLKNLDIAPPYLLVGHSLGGLYVRGFPIYYPELTAGLIIIDPADFTETLHNKRLYYDVLDWNPSRIDSLINAFVSERMQRHQEAPDAIRNEGLYLEEVRRQEFKEITESVLPNIPVHILVGGRFDMPARFRSGTYDDEDLFRSKIKHRMLRWMDVVQSVDKGMLLYSGDAGHFVQWDDPELVISSIKMALADYDIMQSKNNDQ